MDDKTSGKHIIKQGTILAAASVISRIIHDYMFLFTFVLAAQMYLSELDNKFDFSLKFDRKRIKKR